MSRRAQSEAYSGVGEPASLSDVALKKAERASLMVCVLGNLESLPFAKTFLHWQSNAWNSQLKMYTSAESVSLLEYKQTCEAKYMSLHLSHIT